jgi:hypothetical protein
MTKRIVICCDGTWNEPESTKQDRKVPTNVLKLVRAVAPRDDRSGTDQVVYYDQGVGTGAMGVLDRSIGGGTGYGISKNIRDCYNFIANNYVDGDDIFLFGFSRGAYTIRSLGGMLGTVGLLSKNDLRYVPEAYAYYHIDPGKRDQSRFHDLLDSLPRSTAQIRIKCLGVWDTVGALGIPTPGLAKVQRWAGQKWERFRVGFHDCNLTEIVENAFQALAVDERRGPFKPSIWDKTTGQDRVLQAWFAGVHSNIGGGYPDAGLSDTALVWMVNRARECGLAISEIFMSDPERVNGNPLGKLEDSYSAGYKALEYLRVKPHLRPIGQHLNVGEMIHESAIQRMKEDTRYRPENLPGIDDAPNLITDGGRQLLQVGAQDVPVFWERKALRQPANEADATFTAEGQASRSCTIIDFARAGGARLRTNGDLAIGERLQLESSVTGRCASLVVWEHDEEVGVRFVTQ